jgi:hypothetical protein
VCRDGSVEIDFSCMCLSHRQFGVTPRSADAHLCERRASHGSVHSVKHNRQYIASPSSVGPHTAISRVHTLCSKVMMLDALLANFLSIEEKEKEERDTSSAHT